MRRGSQFGGIFPNWDWADIRWCQYCDQVRGEGHMEFDEDDRYICKTCLRVMETL